MVETSHIAIIALVLLCESSPSPLLILTLYMSDIFFKYQLCLSHNRLLSRRRKVDEFEMMNGIYIVRGHKWMMRWFEKREYARTGEVERS